MKKNYMYAGIFLALAICGVAAGRSIEFNSAPANPLPASIIAGADIPAPAAPAPISVPAASISSPMANYIEITGGCDWSFTGTCVNLRSGPGTSYPVVLRLRIGMVFKVEAATTQADGHDWYKIIQDADVRYPDRISSDWYVAADPDSVRSFQEVSEVDLAPNAAITTQKRIVIDLSTETLYAYDGDTLYMQELISSGVDPTVTDPGTFTIYKKMPSRYMQGPLPGVSDEYYDLPGIPWVMYFTQQGAALHGAYWHNNFGHPMSHGCINQSPQNAEKLYEWADVGTPVIVEK